MPGNKEKLNKVRSKQERKQNTKTKIPFRREKQFHLPRKGSLKSKTTSPPSQASEALASSESSAGRLHTYDQPIDASNISSNLFFSIINWKIFGWNFHAIIRNIFVDILFPFEVGSLGTFSFLLVDVSISCNSWTSSKLRSTLPSYFWLLISTRADFSFFLALSKSF